MIPRNYLEFISFFENTFYALECLNYDELTHNNDSYSLGQGVRATGRYLFTHQYTWYMSMMCASNIWCPTLPPGIPGVNSLMSMLFPGRNLLTCALPRVGKRNFCNLVAGIGHTGDIPSRPGVGAENQICEAHIIMCVPLWYLKVNTHKINVPKIASTCQWQWNSALC